jgi:hypothetical protein
LLRVDDGQDAGDRLADVVAVFWGLAVSTCFAEAESWKLDVACRMSRFPNCFICTQPRKRSGSLSGSNVHLVQLGAGRGDLLDLQLAQLGLELIELLREILLVLGPQLAGLDLSGRL